MDLGDELIPVGVPLVGRLGLLQRLLQITLGLAVPRQPQQRNRSTQVDLDAIGRAEIRLQEEASVELQRHGVIAGHDQVEAPAKLAVAAVFQGQSELGISPEVGGGLAVLLELLEAEAAVVDRHRRILTLRETLEQLAVEALGVVEVMAVEGRLRVREEGVGIV